MVKPLEHKERQRTLIGILVIVIIVLALLWYFGFRKPSGKEEQPVIGLMPTEEVKLDLSILDDSLFKSLKSHGLLPVTVEETGRENPFEPY